jgi:alpha-L-rhamnosidase
LPEACYAIPLAMGLLDAAVEERAMERLVAAIDRHEGRLSTGIHGSKRLLLALAEHGRQDLAYRLAFNPRLPSWRYMIDNGATTVWERFDSSKAGEGFNPAGMNDFNHMGLTSAGEWLWRTIVGLNPDERAPGYKRFFVRPRPPGAITWARAGYRSVRGKIAIAWRREESRFELDLTVPVNTTAAVYVPAAGPGAVTEGGVPAAQAKGVEFLRMEEGCAVFEVAGGAYTFRTRQ